MDAQTPEERAAHMARMNAGKKLAEQVRKEMGLPNPKTGIPWGRSKHTTTWKRDVAHARAQAKKWIKRMEDEGLLPLEPVPGSDDEKAKKALEIAMEIALTPFSAKDRLAACNTVLNFTKSKPAIKQDLRVNNAEAWLKEVMDDAGLAPEGTKGEAS